MASSPAPNNDFQYTIINKQNCAYCVRAKTILEENGIVYKEILYYDLDMEAIKKKYNQKTYPFIFLDKFIGGCLELEEYINNNKAKIKFHVEQSNKQAK